MANFVVVLLLFLWQYGAGESPAGTCRLYPGAPKFNTSNFFLNRRPLADAAAICNDGSPAQIYYRPCCNGDTSGDFCNQSKSTWFVSFGDGNQDGWCWDASSCASRVAAAPNLTSSLALPKFFNRSGDQWGTRVGAFAKFAEANPNFYKAFAAYVPYCSSDLFLGECAVTRGRPAFCGRSIALAAIRSLLPDMRKYGADEVVLSGGAGIMNLIPALKRELAGVASKVVALCDGCILFDGGSSSDHTSIMGSDSLACSDAWACPPSVTLPAAVGAWGAHLDESCHGWRCLLAGPGGALERAAAEMPLLARHPLYDVLTLTSRGDPTGQNESLAEELRSQVISALAPADVQLATACRQTQSAFTSHAFFGEGHADARASLGAGASGLMAKGLYTLLRGAGKDKQIDSCQGAGCNPSCEMEESINTLVV